MIYISRNPSPELSKAHHIPCDISDAEHLQSIFRDFQIISTIDILINMAAINHCKPVSDISLEEWNDVLNVNLRSYFVACKEAINIMSKKHYGRIVNVSSIAGRNRSIVSGVHYTSSKAALIGLTRQLALEAGPHGITINCTCPSQTYSEMLLSSMSKVDQEKLSSAIPLRRLSYPVDQIFPIMFLCTSEAAYINGAIIDVNGGQL